MSSYIDVVHPERHAPYLDIPNDVVDYLHYLDFVKLRSPRTVNGYYLDLRGFFRSMMQDRDALFVSKRTGKRLSARRIEQIVARCLQSAGLSGRGFSPHKLRHTAATLMYQGGVDMLALKEILGHENVSTTQIYTHINREQLKKAVAASPLATQKYVEQKPSAPDAPDPHDGEDSPDGSESR